MGESHSLFRIAIFIGFVLLMSSVLAQPWVFVGQPLPPDSTWGQFSSGIQNFPTFYNPFDTKALTFSLGFNDGGPGYETRIKTHGTANSCGSSTYWDCITDPNGPDGNSSYIEITDNNAGPSEFLSLNTTGWPVQGTIRSGTLTLSCHSNMTNAIPINVVVHEWIPSTGGSGNSYLSAIDQNVYCRSGTAFVNTTIQLRVPDAVYNLNGNAHPSNLQMWILGPAGLSFYISALTLTATVVDTTGCSAGDFFSNIGCSFSEFAQNAWNFLILIGSAIAFGFLVIFWFVGMIGIFFGALGSILALPSAPPIVSGLVGILIIGCLFFVAIVIMGKIRGTGNVG